MHIQLKLRPHNTTARCAAAFLEGSNPAAWLAEISRWGIALERLRCFALPHSLQTVEPAGLLVVFQQAADAQQADVKDPYQVLGGKLYIPVQAEVFPVVRNDEWPLLLTWDVQVLHPHIGLVGFHHSDALELSVLPKFGPPRPADWGLAQNGLASRPPFRQIEVRQPKPDDLIQSLRKDEGSKPLSDLSPKDLSEKPAPMDGLRRYLLERALAASGRYRDNFGDSNRPYDGKDWLAGIEQWVQRQLDSIRSKRRSEIERLLDLFDRDTNEALRYALPLDDPYEKRGTAPPTTALGPRSTDFSLGKIGGGSASDAWTLEDEHLRDLRQKYHAAARKAIAEGDFRRAAYIYAHLLHDYNTAANVLRQGEYWREAATLYKDHLDNLPAAAECLEMGKLYWEAIEIYEKLGRHEKVGDLCRLVGAEEKAVAAWEKHIEAALRNDDYIDATRVLLEKIDDPERAKILLLEAWSKPSKQAEPCLRRYFQTAADTEREQLPQRVQEVFQQHTAQQQRPQFLQALLHLVAQTPRSRRAGAFAPDRLRHRQRLGGAGRHGETFFAPEIPPRRPPRGGRQQPLRRQKAQPEGAAHQGRLDPVAQIGALDASHRAPQPNTCLRDKKQPTALGTGQLAWLCGDPRVGHRAACTVAPDGVQFSPTKATMCTCTVPTARAFRKKRCPKVSTLTASWWWAGPLGCPLIL